MTIDSYFSRHEAAGAPARDAREITPANTDLDKVAKSLYIGSTGNVAVRTAEGNDVIFRNMPGGSFLPQQCRQIRTDTTATDIVAFF